MLLLGCGRPNCGCWRSCKQGERNHYILFKSFSPTAPPIDAGCLCHSNFSYLPHAQHFYLRFLILDFGFQYSVFGASCSCAVFNFRWRKFGQKLCASTLARLDTNRYTPVVPFEVAAVRTTATAIPTSITSHTQPIPSKHAPTAWIHKLEQHTHLWEMSARRDTSTSRL